ncbi:NAD-dependent epimerase/dehydratase family protein [Ferrovum myxofaciens]|uniref:NAD(P)-dependent oxidoreductase n=1 Tax=Ferrovum myxofaciens TaxID=416213 RepID=A0A9E6MUM7_9PROT|nr:NAD(P)-dependent oxidoreductase [Ferrovum myxofaciens]QKE38618.1 MAG: NAD(P)-dependent oxidoreductase [Ferrovum myxofaciens]QWY73816.1 MAG: NAD(P)-dependent oxidoreductase [Ferrovum myxofaciens]QWY76570.1 MAG: NAD(P)-dependent oxidoreductase [Ferrovum myxofaciens]
MKFTIFGGHGFVGSALCDHLRRQGHEVFIPTRDATDTIGCELGHVIYAIGLTSDFRTRPIDTINAHVCLLPRLLCSTLFDSWLYLSSTRVYAGLAAEPAREDAPLMVVPNADGIYNLSKLTGEAVCLSQISRHMRIARLANVYGYNQAKETFLGSLLDDIANGREPLIREAPTSSKDYISLEDVCWLLERIALGGKHRIYNVASGVQVSHAELARVLGEKSSNVVTFTKGTSHRSLPQIDITRITSEFGFRPRRLSDELGALVAHSLTRHAKDTTL